MKNMKNILIVVDMQNGFARYEQTIELTEKIEKLLELKIFDVVIGTRFLNATILRASLEEFTALAITRRARSRPAARS